MKIQFRTDARDLRINFKVWTVMIALISSVTACGGGEEGGIDYIPMPTYGAIAVNTKTGKAAITADYSSQKSANKQAEDLCGVDCIVVLEFGSYMCGALARAETVPTFGWASDSSRSDAKSKALDQCAKAGGKGCQIVLDKCNSS